MYNGEMDKDILLVDKPTGMTSFGVVARVRRRLSEEAGFKVKVGHTGTLDPFATGLMILVVGKGTKRAGEFSGMDKEYEAKVRLGAVSTTGDPEGEIENRDEKCGFDKKRLGETIASLVGEIEQTPPVFSAIKVGGVRAYKLARKGKEVKMPKRRVMIYELAVLDFAWPDLVLRAKVSSGTYIRSLAQDIGEKLGCGGYVVELRRTKVGEYSVEDAVKLDGSEKREDKNETAGFGSLG